MKAAATLVTAIAAAALAAGAGSAATNGGTTGQHSGYAQCSPGKVNVSATMRTVQSVMGRPPQAQGQYVAHRAILYRYTAQGWQLASTGAWLWGFGASGTEVSSWRAFGTGAAASTQFSVAAGHYYGVVLQFYWYANADVSGGDAVALAQHQDMGGPSNGYCRA